MNAGAGGITNWIKTAYDKLALFIILFVLLVSGILLSVFVDHEKNVLAAARWNQPDVRPKNSMPIDTSDLQGALESFSEPFQTGYGSNRMMVAEIRVACVKCGRPIPVAAEACTFKNCGAPQPTSQNVEGKDTELDRMPDEWEKKHGLNPTGDDSLKDADGDQFSNLEEFQWGTNPQDPKDYPPPVSKLRWIRTGRMSLPLSFQSIQRPALGEERYVLKNRKTQQDYYVKIGDKVEGYEVVNCEKKTEEVVKPGFSTPIIEDVSVLNLRKDDKVIALTLGKDASQGDMAAELIFLIDCSKPFVKINDVLTLKNNQYKIVDIQKDIVVVSDNLTGKTTSLEKVSQAELRAVLETLEANQPNVPANDSRGQ
ncbi:MAG: hypothetical protein KKG09_09885 [Verrucomicrobia bacterium]|nr:hypothetical protein [Verrucomicrobiota bacterium]MBU4247820.1 hypothetical protein [Verrucomicrobiota bacterium]MBU4291950.1 hypothetical protein [Verrucomicrobiota bacterium]MBU4498300.1 hypothetical protein [Verrucomicrobiota bacterium]MCG2678423.1 hypothetical protein [Kiritimatiellia bacterium]